jgi:hypothetical protein
LGGARVSIVAEFAGISPTGHSRQTLGEFGYRFAGGSSVAAFTAAPRHNEISRLIGLCRPNKGFRDLGPPYVNDPGWYCGLALTELALSNYDFSF